MVGAANGHQPKPPRLGAVVPCSRLLRRPAGCPKQLPHRQCGRWTDLASSYTFISPNQFICRFNTIAASPPQAAGMSARVGSRAAVWQA